MTPSAFPQRILRMSLLLACLSASFPSCGPQQPQVSGETIVMLRHGEKPEGGLGQLTCKGLNRSLALPSLLISRYGKPDFLYAPDPAEQVNDGGASPTYSYVRPLATIEPTAIRLGMPVNAQIGYTHIAELQRELLQPAYAHSLIFVAWEHIKLHDFAVEMLRSYRIGSAKVPDWSDSDYETIYVFHIARTGKDGAPRATLDIQQENLGNTLKDACPGPQ
jgi:hypothetical protein